MYTFKINNKRLINSININDNLSPKKKTKLNNYKVYELIL